MLDLIYTTYMDNEPTNNPEIPNDISELVADIVAREEQRRKAVAILVDRLNSSTTDEDRAFWLRQFNVFTEIDDEFRRQFKELFPDDETEN